MGEFKLIESKVHDVYPFISPLENLKDSARGRNVLITGAGTGIGKAIAKTFAQAGASTVVIAARRLDKLDAVKADIEKDLPDSKIRSASLDVSDAQAVERFFQQMKNDGIIFDTLINNAGAFLDLGPIKDSDPENWWKMWEVMVKGPYLTARAFMRYRDSKPGYIVNVSSGGGAVSTLPGFSGYGAAKSALNRLSEWLGLEGKDSGIIVTAYHPGGVADTEMAGGAPDWMKPHFTETAELSAAVALYLATGRAAYLNGRYVDATWDMEELEGLKEKITSEDLLKMSLLGDMRIKLA